jgi:hypothetical protein
MLNDIIVYNPYYGKNLCNLLSNSIVDKISSQNPESYINITVSNLRGFFMVCGETSHTDKINLTELFSDVMNTIPEELKIPVKVFDLLEYNKPRKLETMVLSETFSKYRTNFKDSYDILKLINEFNKQKVYTNIRKVGTEYYLQSINETDHKFDFEYNKWEPNEITFTSDPIFGKDWRSEKSYYMLIRYIAYTLFESNICSSVNISLTTTETENLTWENVKLNINSNSLITTRRWAESLILDIFDFNIDNIISELNLRDYDFKNEIFHTQETYPWMNRTKLKDVVLV